MDEGTAARLRAQMVDRQLRRRGVRDEAVLQAMGRVPRERFVPPQYEADAYRDEALGIEAGQTISQPYIVARMTELLAPAPGRRILEVGTGSGYQAAILAEIGCRVLSIERHEELAAAAGALIAELGYGESVRIVVGDGSLGRPQDAPYDGIVVTAAAPRIPPSLIGQLAEGGRIVIPVGTRQLQQMIVCIRHGEKLEVTRGEGCVFVPLVGAEGFAPDGAESQRESILQRAFGRKIS